MWDILRRGVRYPDRILPYIYNNLKLRYHRIRSGRFHTVSTNGFELTVDLDDSGVSRQLIRDGVREPVTTAGCTSTLKSKFSNRDSVTVLDLGANIGYYALQPVAQLDGQVNVVAVEPVPRNVELLKKNVERNGFDDAVTVVEAAVASEKRTLELYTSGYSNLFTPSERAAQQNDLVTEERAIEVEARPVSSILDQCELDAADVDVLRFDVDGYEHEIIESARVIFEEADELLINVELHPPYLTRDELTEVIDLLTERPVEIISASPEIDGLTDCYGQDHAYELVLWRG